MPKNPHSDADALPELTDKLKSCDLEIRNYVDALEAENLKLQKKIAKLQAQIVSKDNQIAAILGDEISDSEMEMLDEERAERITEILARAILRKAQARNGNT